MPHQYSNIMSVSINGKHLLLPILEKKCDRDMMSSVIKVQTGKYLLTGLKSRNIIYLNLSQSTFESDTAAKSTEI